MEINSFVQGDLFDNINVMRKNNIVPDMVVTSPPYFDARDYGGETPFSDPNNWEDWCFNVIVELANVIKPNGVIWWNTGSGYADHHKLANVYRLIGRLDDYGIYLVDELPWIKLSGPPKKLSNRPHAMWEHDYVLSPFPKDVIYYRDNVRIPYAQSTLKRLQYRLGSLSADQEGEYENTGKMVDPNPKGAQPPNYLPLPQDTTKRPHPAPMTPLLADFAIRAYTEPGMLVLDPMCGAGTTCIEAAKLERNFIGFDRVQEYLDLATMSYNRLKRGDDPYKGLSEEWEKRNDQSK